MEKVNNVEEIISMIKEELKYVVAIHKLDGITIECSSTEEELSNAIQEVEDLCTELKLLPVSIEIKKDSETTFGVQFPELVPKYSEEETHKMYNDNFEFLFNNIKMKDPKSINRNVLISNMERLTKHSIMTYCRSNINQYKESINDYINNPKYRSKINGWYLEYIDIYLAKG